MRRNLLLVAAGVLGFGCSKPQTTAPATLLLDTNVDRFYVASSGGNDDGPCNGLDQACATVAAALIRAPRGAEVVLLDGTHKMTSVVIDKPVTLTSSRGDEPNPAVIVDLSAVTETAFVVASHDVTIRGLTLRNLAATGGAVIATSVVGDEGPPRGLTIESNVFEDIAAPAILHLGPGALQGALVEGNVVERCLGPDKSAFRFTGGMVGGRVVGNQIRQTGYAGMLFDGEVADLVIEGNEISETPKQGIQVANAEGAYDAVRIENNRLDRTNTSRDGDRGAIRLYGGSGNVTVKNNVISRSYGGVVIRSGASEAITASLNVFVDMLEGSADLRGGEGTFDAPLNGAGAGPTAQGTVTTSPLLAAPTVTVSAFGAWSPATAAVQLRDATGVPVTGAIFGYRWERSSGELISEGVGATDEEGQLEAVLGEAPPGENRFVLNPAQGAFPVNRAGGRQEVEPFVVGAAPGVDLSASLVFPPPSVRPSSSPVAADAQLPDIGTPGNDGHVTIGTFSSAELAPLYGGSDDFAETGRFELRVPVVVRGEGPPVGSTVSAAFLGGLAATVVERETRADFTRLVLEQIVEAPSTAAQAPQPLRATTRQPLNALPPAAAVQEHAMRPGIERTGQALSLPANCTFSGGDPSTVSVRTSFKFRPTPFAAADRVGLNMDLSGSLRVMAGIGTAGELKCTMDPELKAFIGLPGIPVIGFHISAKPEFGGKLQLLPVMAAAEARFKAGVKLWLGRNSGLKPYNESTGLRYIDIGTPDDPSTAEVNVTGRLGLYIGGKAQFGIGGAVAVMGHLTSRIPGLAQVIKALSEKGKVDVASFRFGPDVSFTWFNDRRTLRGGSSEQDPTGKTGPNNAMVSVNTELDVKLLALLSKYLGQTTEVKLSSRLPLWMLHEPIVRKALWVGGAQTDEVVLTPGEPKAIEIEAGLAKTPPAPRLLPMAPPLGAQLYLPEGSGWKPMSGLSVAGDGRTRLIGTFTLSQKQCAEVAAAGGKLEIVGYNRFVIPWPGYLSPIKVTCKEPKDGAGGGGGGSGPSWGPPAKPGGPPTAPNIPQIPGQPGDTPETTHKVKLVYLDAYQGWKGTWTGKDDRGPFESGKGSKLEEEIRSNVKLPLQLDGTFETAWSYHHIEPGPSEGCVPSEQWGARYNYGDFGTFASEHHEGGVNLAKRECDSAWTASNFSLRLLVGIYIDDKPFWEQKPPYQPPKINNQGQFE